MIFAISQTRNHAWLSGVTARPESADRVFKAASEKCPNASIQLVDLDKVPGSRYLTIAITNASISFRSKQPIARTLGMELLLYIAAEKQIHEALRRVGITNETQRVAAIAVGNTSSIVADAAESLKKILGQDSDDHLLDDWTPFRTENVRTAFNIGDLELKAIRKEGEAVTSTLERLAVERSALVAARR